MEYGFSYVHLVPQTHSNLEHPAPITLFIAAGVRRNIHRLESSLTTFAYVVQA